jgi:ribosomal protein L40E
MQLSIEPEIQEPHESDIIPLGQAVLCADCDAISSSRDGRCRACGSEAISLARVLNRKVA